MYRRVPETARFRAFVLLCLFLLLGLNLGVHTLSHEHRDHVLWHTPHPDHPGAPDGDIVPDGDLCAVDLFAQTAYDTPYIYDIPEVAFTYVLPPVTLPETPVLRHAERHFSLRAPPSSLL